MFHWFAVDVDASLNERPALGHLRLFPHVYHFNRDVRIDGPDCLSNPVVELVCEDTRGFVEDFDTLLPDTSWVVLSSHSQAAVYEILYFVSLAFRSVFET